MTLRITHRGDEKGISMPHYDLLVTGGRIVDSTGNPWFYGDVAIQVDRITAINRPCEIVRDQSAHVV
jgi:N-acyl-D-aspartate/D-glutamate deacylase